MAGDSHVPRVEPGWGGGNRFFLHAALSYAEWRMVGPQGKTRSFASLAMSRGVPGVGSFRSWRRRQSQRVMGRLAILKVTELFAPWRLPPAPTASTSGTPREGGVAYYGDPAPGVPAVSGTKAVPTTPNKPLQGV